MSIKKLVVSTSVFADESNTLWGFPLISMVKSAFLLFGYLNKIKTFPYFIVFSLKYCFEYFKGRVDIRSHTDKILLGCFFYFKFTLR